MAWAWVTDGPQTLLVYAYDDPQVGPCARGGVVARETFGADVRRAVEQPNMTLRLAGGRFAPEPVDAATVGELGLPDRPWWAEGLPEPGPWRSDPALVGRFLVDCPDDLKVRFYFERTMENMWVTTRSVDAEIGGYAGMLLNDPHTEGTGLIAGSAVSYRAVRGAPLPIWVSTRMRRDFGEWSSVCPKCGFDFLIWAVADLIGPGFARALHGKPHRILGTRCAACDAPIVIKRRRGY